MPNQIRLSRRALAALAVISLLWFPTRVVAQEPAPSPSPPPVLDINTASVEQLTIVVESEEIAQHIIENRPYANKRQLVSRRLVSEEDYERIKDRIVARRVQAEP